MSLSRELADSVVLVTGAARGLGRAMCEALARRGAKLALLGRPGSEAALEEIVRKLATEGVDASRLLVVTGDVVDAGSCREAVARTVDAFGRLNVLVNNAGLGMDRIGSHVKRITPFDEIPADLWRRMVDVNVNGTFLMTAAAMPALRGAGWGRIVNLTTSLTTMYRVGMSPYGPTKAAIEAMTKVWAQELATTPITANALLPGGPADTAMIPADDFPDRASLIPPAAMGPPVCWLASRRSDGITGMRIVAKTWPREETDEAIRAALAPAAW